MVQAGSIVSFVIINSFLEGYSLCFHLHPKIWVSLPTLTRLCLYMMRKTYRHMKGQNHLLSFQSNFILDKSIRHFFDYMLHFHMSTHTQPPEASEFLSMYEHYWMIPLSCIRRYASYIFHPYEPFVISVQHTFSQTLSVNFHYRKWYFWASIDDWFDMFNLITAHHLSVRIWCYTNLGLWLGLGLYFQIYKTRE
jgi:De-etiolated protein 1 Det1